MKWILLPLICISIATNCFAKRANPLAEWQGAWKIKTMINAKKQLVSIKNKTNTVEINASDNNMSINLGCNRMNAKINSVGRDNITFGNAMSTRMGCPNDIGSQEMQLTTLLPKIDKYSIGNKGNEITFFIKGKKVLVLKSASASIATKYSKPTFEGNYRIIQQLENGEMAERNLMETTLTIDKKGTYYAYVGCNRINGGLEITDNKNISFKQGAMTLMGCLQEDINMCEKYFLENIAKAKTFTIETNKVILFDADNMLMMLERK